MNLYDLIKEIAKNQCENLYEIKISIGITDIDNEKILLNNLEIDFEDIICSSTFASKLLEAEGSDLNFVCIQTKNNIFIIDTLGEIL